MYGIVKFAVLVVVGMAQVVIIRNLFGRAEGVSGKVYV